MYLLASPLLIAPCPPTAPPVSSIGAAPRNASRLLRNCSGSPRPPSPVGGLEYELPRLVASSREGWVYSAQAAAVVSALFCGAETQIISTIKSLETGQNNPIRHQNPGTFRFLLLLSYSAFILNASATIASLVMIDRLGEIPVRMVKRRTSTALAPMATPSSTQGMPLLQMPVPATAPHLPQDTTSPQGSTDEKYKPIEEYVLETHEAGARWTWAKWHCFSALVAGSWCMFLQMWLFIWLYESPSVAIAMGIVCIIGISPWFAFFVPD